MFAQSRSNHRIRERTDRNRMATVYQRNAITAGIRIVKRIIQHVFAEKFFCFDKRLRKMLRIDRTNTDMVAIFNKRASQSKCQTITLV